MYILGGYNSRLVVKYYRNCQTGKMLLLYKRNGLYVQPLLIGTHTVSRICNYKIMLFLIIQKGCWTIKQSWSLCALSLCFLLITIEYALLCFCVYFDHHIYYLVWTSYEYMINRNKKCIILSVACTWFLNKLTIS